MLKHELFTFITFILGEDLRLTNSPQYLAQIRYVNFEIIINKGMQDFAIEDFQVTFNDYRQVLTFQENKNLVKGQRGGTAPKNIVQNGEEETMQTVQETQENLESARDSFKDAYIRVWNKIEILYKRAKKQHLLSEIKQGLGITKKNRETLNMLYVHPVARKFIAACFRSGKYRREIILGKRKCPITERGLTNTARNLLKSHNFDCFAFIQGGSDNRSSLRNRVRKNE